MGMGVRFGPTTHIAAASRPAVSLIASRCPTPRVESGIAHPGIISGSIARTKTEENGSLRVQTVCTTRYNYLFLIDYLHTIRHRRGPKTPV